MGDLSGWHVHLFNHCVGRFCALFNTLIPTSGKLCTRTWNKQRKGSVMFELLMKLRVKKYKFWHFVMFWNLTQRETQKMFWIVSVVYRELNKTLLLYTGSLYSQTKNENNINKNNNLDTLRHFRLFQFLRYSHCSGWIYEIQIGTKCTRKKEDVDFFLKDVVSDLYYVIRGRSWLITQ